MIIKAGFQDVKEVSYKWPIGEWPQDPRLKDIGRWNAHHWSQGIEPWTLRMLTQYMGVSWIRGQFLTSTLAMATLSWILAYFLQWTLEEVKTWTAKVQSSILNRRYHAYQPLYVSRPWSPFLPTHTLLPLPPLFCPPVYRLTSIRSVVVARKPL